MISESESSATQSVPAGNTTRSTKGNGEHANGSNKVKAGVSSSKHLKDRGKKVV